MASIVVVAGTAGWAPPPTAPPASPQASPGGTPTAPPPAGARGAAAPARPAGAREAGARVPPRPQGDISRPSATTTSGDPAESLPPVRVEPRFMDFGFVPPKSVNKISFKLWNSSDQPVTVAAVNPSCKCTTTTDIVGQSIAPGTFVELGAALEAGAAVGPKAANIKVLIDGFGRTLDLALRADVTLPIKLTPGYINAVGGKSEQGRIVVESTDGKPFRILSVHGAAPSYVGFDALKDEAVNRYVIEYDLTRFPEGRIPRYCIIETDHPACPTADLLVRHDSVQFPTSIRGIRDFRANLGLLQPGAAGEAEVRFGKLAPSLTFTEVVAQSDDFTAELVEQADVDTDDSHETVVRFKVKPRDGLSGLFYGPVVLKAGERMQEFIVFGRVAGPAGTSGAAGPG